MDEGDPAGRELHPRTACAGGLAIFVGLIAGFIFVPQWILTDLGWPGRPVRIWIVTGWIGALFVGVAYATHRWSRPRGPSSSAGPAGSDASGAGGAR